MDFKTQFGMSHKINSDKSTHTTYYDGISNTRVSYDTDKDGKINNLHSTDQNKSKNDPDRHK